MSNFYKDKKVVVTGGAGFVGSHLVELLLERGANVTVMDNLSRGNNKIKGAKYLAGDASNINGCMFFFDKAFAVFNLAAAVAGVLYNEKNNTGMFLENVKLQAIPPLAATIKKVPHFLQISSVCVYAPEYNHPAIETNGGLDEPIINNSGYSWSKRMGEKSVTAWADLEHAVIVRPSNIYGPRDYFDEKAHVIPAVIKKCINSTDGNVQLYGTGRERREFIYVKDIVNGILLALEHGRHKEAYNIGLSTLTDEGVSIKELAETIGNIASPDKKLNFLFDSSKGGGDNARWSNCSKAKNELGFEAKTRLYDGLKETIEWYKKGHKK